MVSLGDLLYILSGKLAGPPVDEVPQIPGVDEEDLVGPVTIFSVGLVPAEKPQARRDLGVQEELWRKIHDAVHESGLDEPLSDLPLPGGFGG